MDRNRMRILLIEDNPSDVMFIGELLAASGAEFEMVSASSLASGLQCLSEQHFDTLLLDLGLPDSEGLETFLRANQFAPCLPIIVLTGLADEDTTMRAVKAGAQDYLEKWGLNEPILTRSIRYAIERKQAEATLRREKEFNETLIQTSPAFFIAIDPDGRVMMMNRSFLDALGYDSHEVVGKDAPLFVAEPDREIVREMNERLLVKGEPLRLELRHLARHGRELIVEWHTRPVVGEQGRIDYFFGMGIDITERTKAEAALRASEEKYRSIFENALEGIYQTSPEGRFLSLNPALANMIGYESPEEAMSDITDIGRQLYADPDERKKLREILDKASFVDGYETQFRHKEGSTIWVSLKTRAIRDADGEICCYEGVLENITERKLAEDELRQRERYFRSILTSIQEGILVIGPDYRITDINKDVLGFVDDRREMVLGRPCYQVLFGYDRPCDAFGYECHLLDLFKGRETPGLKHQQIIEKGSGVWLDILSSPLRDEEGRVTHIIKSIRNVTQEVNIRDQLRQAQKLEAIGTLAGGIAHDFNNILGIILGYTEISMFGLPKDSAQYANLQQVMKATHRAKELINQILAFSRKTEQERVPLQIGPILKEVLKMLRAALPVTIEIRQKIATDQEGDTVLADPTQIHQILMNLCTNAGYAMRGKGGVLEVGLSNAAFEPNDWTRPVDLEPGHYVVLTVSDNGHGISRSVMEKIFEPYFTTKRMGEGTGLGLSVVHGIVKSYGGAIAVQSETGVGSTFSVHLPRVEQEMKPEDHMAASPLRGDERILLVDDERGLVDSGTQALELLGYKVTARLSSVEALDAFRAQPDGYDLIITDLTMPHMTGIELAKAILSIRPGIPIILCTGFSELITEETARAIGIRELIMKPLIMTDMARAIRKVLEE